MNKILIPIAGAFAVLLVSCDKESPPSSEGGVNGPAAPAPPTAEVVTALEAQPLGQKLLGNTLALSGKDLVKADLNVAPEYYFIYYSASW